MLFELDVEADAGRGIVRFRLRDEPGRHLAANEVRLGDHSPLMWEGLFDTLRHVLRDEGSLRLEGQTELATADQLLERLGVFLGQKVLGPAIMGPLLATAQHRTLLVKLPAVTNALAAAMARVPWEIARPAPGEPPLMSRNLVVRAAAQGVRPIAPEPAGDTVRVLLVYAEAPGSRPLAMRLERENLLRLFFDEILPQRRVEVDVLCHGVTRARLVEQITARGGYEVVHWSGHGHHNLLELRGEDGGAEHITGPEFVGLFTEQAGGFIPRLVFLSACLSGTLIDIRDWAAFQAAMAGQRADERRHGDAPGVPEILDDQPGYTGTALELLRAGVPQVVAMRYEVGDTYARDLAHRFYRHLLADRADHPTDSALALARTELAKTSDPTRHHAVDHATPLIFGEPGRIAAGRGRSAQLPRRRPRPQPLLAAGRTELDPRPPAAFVGRSAELTRLAESWLPRDRQPVAIVQGMAGMGKTSIASEAIALWHTRFDQVFAYQAKPTPLTIDEFCRDLHNRLALASEPYREKCREFPYEAIYLETGPAMRGEDRYAAMRANLIGALRDQAILLVVDNYETNLEANPRDDGHASQDPEWDRLLADLAHALPPTGSRLLITTRHWPRALAGDAVLEMPLGPLSLAEAALFLRGHDTLRQLHARGDASKALVLRLMDVSRGHPLILDRLSALADDPPALSQALDTLQGDGYRALPNLFQRHRSPEQQAQETAYLEDVAIGSVDLLLGRVSPDARRLLWIITHANEPVSVGLVQGAWSGKSIADEELERSRAMLQVAETLPESVRSKMPEVPPELRQQLEQPNDPIQAPAVEPLLQELDMVGLLTREQAVAAGRGESPRPPLLKTASDATYAFHELVRERVAAWMDAHEGERGDRSSEQVWIAYGERYAGAFEQLLGEGGEGTRDRAVEAGRRALGYLVRARAFDLLGEFASSFIATTHDPELLRQVIADLRKVADEVPPSRSRWILRSSLADALLQAGHPNESLDLYALAAVDAEADEDWHARGAIYSNWAIALRSTGQLDASRTMYQRGAEAKRQAGTPAVAVVASEIEALRIDVMQGHAERAMPEIEQHLDELRDWWRDHREGRTVREAADPESLGGVLMVGLDIAQMGNRSLGRWQDCLDLYFPGGCRHQAARLSSLLAVA